MPLVQVAALGCAGVPVNPNVTLGRYRLECAPTKARVKTHGARKTGRRGRNKCENRACQPGGGGAAPAQTEALEKDIV
eukprot:67896-Prorocentrum_minimum.AAC.1